MCKAVTTNETCSFPTCSRKAEHNHLCFLHKIYSDVPQVKEKPKPIAAHSSKRAKYQREYVKIVKEMLEENPLCEIKEEGCQILATGLHHQRKRSPATLLDRRYLKRSCDSCNSWAEIYPKEAIEKGHSVSKF